MTKQQPLFQVIVNAKGVSIEKLTASSPSYAKAAKDAVLRDRDAILLFNRISAGKRPGGTYSFQHLDAARTFAMLHLENRNQAVADNIDQILAYDGASAGSGT